MAVLPVPDHEEADFSGGQRNEISGRDQDNGRYIVYSEECTLERHSDVRMLVLGAATAYLWLNPDIECAKPDCGFCKYPDGEHKETNKGAYDRLGEAYASVHRYAAENGYQVADFHRESYIDGIWSKGNAEDWLTEVPLPGK